MLISSRKANPVPEIAGLNLIPALVILLREIIVSGLREYLAGLQISVPVSAQTASKTLAIKAHAYGFEGVRVDGNDVLAVIEVTAQAADKALVLGVFPRHGLLP